MRYPIASLLIARRRAAASLSESRRDHLASHEGDLGLERQILGAQVVTGEQGHAAEHALVVADQLVVGGVVTLIPGIEPEAGDPVEPHGAHEVLAHARRPAGGDAAATLDAAVEEVDL